MYEIQIFGIKNSSKDTTDANNSRELCGRHGKINPVPLNIKSIIREFEDCAVKRPSKLSHCTKNLKPQGITGHVAPCEAHCFDQNIMQ
jgi:hypothetical protein